MTGTRMKIKQVVAALTGKLQRLYRTKAVDELGKLDRKYRRWNKHLTRFKKLKEEAATWPNADKKPTDQTAVYRGKYYEIEYSVGAKDREITNMRGVMDALGLDVFLAHCTFPLSTLDVLLPNAAELKLLIEDPNGGSRYVEIRQRERKLKVAA